MELKTYYWLIGIFMFLILIFVIKYYANYEKYFPQNKKKILEKILKGLEK